MVEIWETHGTHSTTTHHFHHLHLHSTSIIHFHFHSPPFCHFSTERSTDGQHHLLNHEARKYFWVFGCKCYILKKGTRLRKFEKKCDEDFLLGYSTTSKAYRVWNLKSGTLEEVHDVEFDETNGSQEEDENLDDVWGTLMRTSLLWMYPLILQPSCKVQWPGLECVNSILGNKCEPNGIP